MPELLACIHDMDIQHLFIFMAAGLLLNLTPGPDVPRGSEDFDQSQEIPSISPSSDPRGVGLQVPQCVEFASRVQWLAAS